ncbi:ankyrin repeat-containing domain protein [Aspergillus cavernicola]|uniref:Ankyrin repeat-containing domain protein n=1 Tax=Aspergillus cavernicola TaxID=176166 RepID=A0ABR4ICD8_9EURO
MTTHPPHNTFQIGVICALPAEAAAVRLMFDESFGRLEGQSSADTNAYELGRIGGYHVAVTLMSDYGTSTASRVAAFMVSTFPDSLRVVFMVGIGGGIPFPGHDIRLGDVVVSYPTGTSPGVIQYDLGKATADGYERTGSLNRPPTEVLAALNTIKADKYMGITPCFPDYMEKAVKGKDGATKAFARPDPKTDRLFSREDNNQEVEVSREERGDNIPRVHFGTIASGNTVVKDRDVAGELRKRSNGALCFEMEAAGLMNDFPCLVVRGISDYADGHKNDEWQAYAALAAAAYAKEVIGRMRSVGLASQSLVKDVCEALRKEFKGVNDRLDKAHEVKEQNRRTKAANAQSDEQKRYLAMFETSEYEEFKDINRDSAAGTCQWALEDSKYTCWTDNHRNDILWVSADPGCGKSVLARKIVSIHSSVSDPSVNCCYFFFKDNGSQNHLYGALCAILHQLFSQQPHLLHHAISVCDPSISLQKGTGKLWKIFMAASSDPTARNTVCVLDGLDECCSGDREILFKHFREFYSKAHSSTRATTLKFFVTSRPYSNIGSGFRLIGDDLPAPHLNLHDNPRMYDEVDIVVRERVKELGKAIPLSPDVQARLERQFLEVENRTYLWVNLAIEHVRIRLLDSLRPAAESIPALPPSVSAAYENTLARIQTDDDSGEVRRIFQIIVGARKPLDKWEMAIALGVAMSDAPDAQTVAKMYDPEYICTKMPQRCGLFIFIRDNTIYLIHQTAREFLLQSGIPGSSNFAFKLIDAETLLARTCVRYLSMDDLISEGLRIHSDNRTAFRGYSSEHWVDHVRNMSPSARTDLEGLILGLYQTKFAIWAPHFWLEATPFRYSPEPMIPGYKIKPLNPAHLAAFNDHTDILRKLLMEDKQMACHADTNGTTALIWSSWNGHYSASELLLKQGADVNAESQRFGTPLLVASMKGHKKIVELLLDMGADINHETGTKGRAHYLMHSSTHPEVMDRGAYTGTALWSAALNGHVEIVQLLLEKGALGLDFALMAASRGGHLTIIQLLMTKGADVNARDEEGVYGTAVQAASMGGHLGVLQFLCKNNAEDDTQVGRFKGALNAAATLGHGEIVVILLARGGDNIYESADYIGALQAACFVGDLRAVTALAPHVADINAQTVFSMSALCAASSKGHTKVVHVLLRHGADARLCDSVDNPDYIPLQAAVSGGYVEIVEMLIVKGADVNVGNPLHAAASGGYIDIVEMLIDERADVNTGNPLLAAARGGYTEIVEILIDEGAEVNVGNPLHAAASGGYIDIVEMLIDEGANVKIGNPLYAAAIQGHAKVVKMLIDKGADVNAENPLYHASYHGHLEVVQSLIKANVDINVRHNFQSAYEAAIEQKHYAIRDCLHDSGALDLTASSRFKKYSMITQFN